LGGRAEAPAAADDTLPLALGVPDVVGERLQLARMANANNVQTRAVFTIPETLAECGEKGKTRPSCFEKLALSVGPAITSAQMTHPLASQLAPIMNRDVEELRSIVAEWVVSEANEHERARYRMFGAELSKVQARISKRPAPPTEEEIEIALTALLALSGRRFARPRA
jgi:hypothetical protein